MKSDFRKASVAFLPSLVYHIPFEKGKMRLAGKNVA